MHPTASKPPSLASRSHNAMVQHRQAAELPNSEQREKKHGNTLRAATAHPRTCMGSAPLVRSSSGYDGTAHRGHEVVGTHPRRSKTATPRTSIGVNHRLRLWADRDT